MDKKYEALLIQILSDVARGESLYVIVISPQNETHISITFHILYGTHHEYRNMSLQYSLKFLAHISYEHTLSRRSYIICN